MTGAHFIKMQGLGNDFVVFDGRSASIDLDPARLRAPNPLLPSRSPVL